MVWKCKKCGNEKDMIYLANLVTLYRCTNDGRSIVEEVTDTPLDDYLICHEVEIVSEDPVGCAECKSDELENTECSSI